MLPDLPAKLCCPMASEEVSIRLWRGAEICDHSSSNPCLYRRLDHTQKDGRGRSSLSYPFRAIEPLLLVALDCVCCLPLPLLSHAPVLSVRPHTPSYAMWHSRHRSLPSPSPCPMDERATSPCPASAEATARSHPTVRIWACGRAPRVPWWCL